MQYAFKRQVGHSARGPRQVERRPGDEIRPDAVEVGARCQGDLLAVLWMVETLLDGEVRVAVAPFPTATSTAMSASVLADSLAALVRGVASSEMSDRNIRITVAPCELRNGSASAAGVLPGMYVAFDIEQNRGYGCGTVCRELSLDAGVGLTAARDAVVGAGGSIGLSRAPTGGARFTAYVPARG